MVSINQRDMFRLYEPPHVERPPPRLVPEAVYQDASVRLVGSNSIRLVAILPGRHDKISLDMYAVPSVTEADYEALSYVWGEPANGMYTVTLNQHPNVPVTYNLFNALHRLRRRYNKRVIWIDQLCINQADHLEKESQVAMMADIYRQAACVNVWLGESATATNALIAWRLEACSWEEKMLKAKAERAECKRKRYYRKYSEDQFERELHKDTARALSEQPARVRNSAFAELKEAIRSRDNKVLRWAENIERVAKQTRIDVEDDVAKWYTRLWTVQEFALARQVYICWGEARLLYNHSRVTVRDESDVERLLQRMYRLGKTVSHEVMADAERTLLTVYAVVRPEQDLSYGALSSLRDNITVECNDGRDFVYGLLGLLDPREAQLIGVDYTLSRAQLAAKASYATMKYSKAMTALVANWHSPFVGGVPVRLGPREPDPYWTELPLWSVNLCYSRSRLGMFSNPEQERDGWRLDDTEHNLKISIDDADMSMDSTFRYLSIRGSALDVVVSPALRYDNVPSCLGYTTRSGAGCTMEPYCRDVFRVGKSVIESLQSLEALSGSIFHKALEGKWSRKKYHPEEISLEELEDFRKEFLSDFETEAGRLEQSFLERNQTRLQANYLESSADIRANPAYLVNLARHPHGCNVFATRGGLLGFSRQPMQQGDILLHVQGSELLLVLRDRESQDRESLYSFHGMAYVPGVSAKSLFGPRWARGLETERLRIRSLPTSSQERADSLSVWPLRQSIRRNHERRTFRLC